MKQSGFDTRQDPPLERRSEGIFKFDGQMYLHRDFSNFSPGFAQFCSQGFSCIFLLFILKFFEVGIYNSFYTIANSNRLSAKEIFTIL